MTDARRRDIDTIHINGTVGSGKTTLADAIGSLETRPYAVIDLDGIRWMSPAPSSDPFNHELELVNLRSIVANYRRAGAERFILAGVIETPTEIPRYMDAVQSTGLLLCRLVARPEVITARLVRRHEQDPDGRDWHLARFPVLDRILDDRRMEDLVLDSSETSSVDLAREVRRVAGWDAAEAGGAGKAPV